MNPSLAFLAILAIKISKADIDCTLKSGVDQAYNKISDAAIKGLKFHEGRNRGNMNLFECTCSGDDQVIFSLF